MNKLFLAFVCAFLISLSTTAQTDIQMNILHKSGEADFEYGTTMTNNLGFDYDVSRLEYYLSDFVLVHDGGNEIPIDELVVLANGDNVLSLDMGNHELMNLEYLKFHVGVNPSLNNLDPSTYEAGHPLAFHDPSMHWGWASGYKFVAIEGTANNGDNYQFHGLGNANYFEVIVPTDLISDSGFLEINLLADVGKMLQGIELDSDLQSHGETGKARTVLENMRDFVFSENNTTLSVDENKNLESLDIYPNPSHNGMTKILLHSKTNEPYYVAVMDILGKEVARLNNLQPNVPTVLNLNKSGIYIISIHTADGGFISKKLIIQ